MAAIDPDISLSDQLKKIKFEELAKNTRKLSESLAQTSRISSNMMIQMVANLNTMKMRNAASQLQLKADRAELRVKQQRLTLLNNEIRTLQTELRNKKALADSIANRGRDLRGRFAGPDKLVSALEQVDKVRDAYRKLLPKKQRLPIEIEGLENSINATSSQIKLFKLEAITEVLGKFAQMTQEIANAFGNLVRKIYEVQQDLSVQMGTATQLYIGAIKSSISSYFSSDKPILDPKDVLGAITAFKKEFGTILAPEEAERIATEAKRLGVSADVYSKAKRAFLGTGSAETSRMTAMTEFTKQGLSAGSAIQFAAENANLVAIAGEKYAASLFRAAAESQRIGVSLGDVEKFANSVVGDFESTLTNFAELSALGVDFDLVTVAATAQFGTPEEMQNVLKEQLSLSGITGEELQRNRTLRLALTQSTGFDESTLLRMAGVAQAPTERTVQEQQLDKLSTIVELLSKVSRIIAIVTQLAVGALAGGIVGSIGGLPGTLIGATLGLLGSLGTVMKSVTGYAEGGLVTGPGTSTSDSISAMLSDDQPPVKKQPTGAEKLTGVKLPETETDINVLRERRAAAYRAWNSPVRDTLMTLVDPRWMQTNKTPDQIRAEIAKNPPRMGLITNQDSYINRSLGDYLAYYQSPFDAFGVETNTAVDGNLGSIFLGGQAQGADYKADTRRNPLDMFFKNQTSREIMGHEFGHAFDHFILNENYYGKTRITNPSIVALQEAKNRPAPSILEEIRRMREMNKIEANMPEPTKRALTSLDWMYTIREDPTKGPGHAGIGQGMAQAFASAFQFVSQLGNESVYNNMIRREASKNVNPNKTQAQAEIDKVANLMGILEANTPGMGDIATFIVNHPSGMFKNHPLRSILTNQNVFPKKQESSEPPYEGPLLKKQPTYTEISKSLPLSLQDNQQRALGTSPLMTRLIPHRIGVAPNIFDPNTYKTSPVKRHAGGLVHGSGEVPALLKGGEYVVNPKATSEYGTDFLNNLNTGAYAKPTRVIDNEVSVNNDALKGELRQIISTMRDMRIEMSGYDVGNISANEARSPLRTR